MNSEKLSPQNQIFLNVFPPLYKGKEGSFEPSSHFCNIKRQQLIFVFFRKHRRCTPHPDCGINCNQELCNRHGKPESFCTKQHRQKQKRHSCRNNGCRSILL